jgi:hypothetical protein
VANGECVVGFRQRVRAIDEHLPAQVPGEAQRLGHLLPTHGEQDDIGIADGFGG